MQVLLKPRVVTQNNIKATITRGEEIPYTTLTAVPQGGDGVTIVQQVPQVSFKIAALTLAVLPRISASGTVILEVDVDNGSRGTVQANGNISVNTQRVQTTVLVKDQGTTVIGGIYETLETRSQDRTPGLSRVPFIGSFFKRNYVRARTKANCSSSSRRASSRTPRRSRPRPIQSTEPASRRARSSAPPSGWATADGSSQERT